MTPQRNRHRVFLALVAAALFAFGGTGNEARADKIKSNPDLVPAGEKDLMGSHKADQESIKWRPGKGLAVKSGDGKFGLITRLRLQMLATYEKDDGADAEVGTMLRRARLQFIGNTFGKHNKFKAEFAFSPRDLRFTSIDGNNFPRETPLLTWYMNFDKYRDLTVRAGQYKIPFSRQRVISSGNQQMVDRSIANGEFNLDRDIGFDIRSKDLFGAGMFRYYAGVYNGEGRSAFGNGDTNLMYLARFEFLPLGLFKDYSEGDHQRLAKPGISIGVGYAYAPNARGNKVNRSGTPSDGGTTDFHSVTADLTFKYMGLSLSSEFFLRDTDRNPGAGPVEAARRGYGWFAQAGYMLPKQPVEFAGRFGQVRGTTDSTALGDGNEAGLAVSYYPGQHPFKLQADAFQVWSDGSSEGTTRVRVQIQLAF